jgi:hypothetical protein
VWPTEQAFIDAPCGDVKRLHVISGGKGFEDAKIWHTYQSVAFTKTCL